MHQTGVRHSGTSEVERLQRNQILQAGNVGIAYYGTPTPGATELNAYITQTKDAADAQPLFYSAAINDTTHPIYTDGGLQGPSPRTDFIGGTYDLAGNAFWAGAVAQLGPPDSNNVWPTTGYVGRLQFGTSTPSAMP